MTQNKKEKHGRVEMAPEKCASELCSKWNGKYFTISKFIQSSGEWSTDPVVTN